MQSSVSQCAPNLDKCSDSSIGTDHKYQNIRFLNSTSNYGIGGAACVTLSYPSKESEFVYFNSIDSNDYRVLELLYSDAKLKSSNIINSTNVKAMFYITDSILTIENCVIIKPQTTLLQSNGVVVFVNTYSDEKYDNHSFIDESETICIKIEAGIFFDVTEYDGGYVYLNQMIIFEVFILIFDI